MKELISIVIPFYNRKEYVKVMVESIKDQSYDFWELLLIDDGSNDGSAEYVQKQAEIDKRIKYFNRNEISAIKGACCCRNIGLKASKGKYVIFFDSDDWIPQDCLKNRISFMESNPDLDFSVFPYFKYFDKEKINGLVVSGVNTQEDDLYNLIIRNLPFTVVSNIYKLDSLRRKNVTWDEKLLSIQDADFNLSALLAGLKYRYCADYGFDYYVRMYQNVPSVSRSILRPEHMESHLYYFQKQAERIMCREDNELKEALKFLSISFYQLLCDTEEYKQRLLLLIKDLGMFYYTMLFRDLIYMTAKRFNINSKAVKKVLFYNLSVKFHKSAKLRGLAAKETYNISKTIIYQIENLMI